MMDNLSGKAIKGYQIRNLIGEGGFAVVYSAFQPVVEREVVIKAILPMYANDPGFIRNFEAEAHLIARLEHLNIVPLYDYWRDPDGAFLVMRYLRGGSLLDKFKVGELWDLEKVTRVLEQIAAALAVAHRNDVVHQDIKPANILLDEDDNAYLTDFGIAKDLANSVNLASMGEEDTIHGSPAYIAPEQINRQEITKQSDIYSLGLVLYEMLAGAHPFEGAGLMQLLTHQRETTLPPLQEFRPELPESLNTVVWRATEKRADARYSQVTDMAQDLRRIVDDIDDLPVQTPATPQRQSVFKTGGAKKSRTAVINLNMGPPNPYKGLRAFQEGDAADFYGRDELIQSVLNRITLAKNGNRFIAVVGPSGSGKSSMVKAGLIPTIRRSTEPEWQNVFIVEMTPGAQPLQELETALLRVATKPDDGILRRLTANKKGLAESVDNVLPDDNSELVLLVDQFEEIFTMTQDEKARNQFLNALNYAATHENSRVRIIATLRADFYDRPLLYPGIGDLIRSHTEVVLPLSADEIRAAIEEPAKRVGLALENGLVDMIIDDVMRQPGSLPLLQYTLTELYERREDNIRMTIAAYEDSGGVTGALARRAEQLYERMNDEDQRAAQQLFLRLVNIGEGSDDTRRRALRSELNSLFKDRKIMREVLEEFGKYRLLSFDNDPTTRAPTVEVAHEALIRRWTRLRDWINNSRDDLRTQRKLAAATAEWSNAGRDTSFLATGARLAQFETLLDAKQVVLSEDERAYIQDSIEMRERAARFRRMVFIGAIAVAFIMAGLAIFAAYQSFQAADARDEAIGERDRADQEATISRSRELAASALVNIDQLDLALLLSMNALETASTFEAHSSLLTALQTEPRLESYLPSPNGTIRTLTYSPDGSIIVAAGRGNVITLWDTTTYQPIREPLQGHTNWVNSIAFSSDGALLASGSEDRSIILWDVSTGEMIGAPLTGHADDVRDVAFSPDGTLLASSSTDGTIILWDVESGEPIGEPLSQHEDIVYTVAFSPDGTLLASGSADTTIRLWDISEPDSITSELLEGHANWVFDIDFNSDGTLLASSSADSTIIVWDVESRNPSAQLRAHNEWVRSVEFSPDGSRIISGAEDNLILIWDVASGRLIDGFRNIASDDVWTVDYHPDGERIISGGDDASPVYVWYATPQVALGTTWDDHSERVIAVALSEDDHYAASVGGIETDLAVRVWDVDTGEVLHRLDGHTQTVTALAFSPDNTRLASGSTNVIIWDVESGEQIGEILPADAVFDIVFSPDGNAVYLGDNDGRIARWDISGAPDTWESTQVISGHSDRVTSLDLNQEGTMLVSGSRDRTVRLWNLADGTQVGDPFEGHSEGVESVAFQPGGSLIASGSRDFTVRLWDIDTGDALEPLTAHENWVMTVDFSPDGNLLVSAGGDTRIIMWDVGTGRMLGLPFTGHEDWVNAVAFSENGEFLISGGRDNRVIHWQTALEDWEILACTIANRDLNDEEIQTYFQTSMQSDVCTRLINTGD